MRNDERQLEDAARRGKTIQWGRNDPPFSVPAERWVEDLHLKQPVFGLVRLWCGGERSTGVNEAEALQAEIERLRELILETARWLKVAGHLVMTSRLHKAIGGEPGLHS